jgi:predicted aspartyl protease
MVDLTASSTFTHENGITFKKNQQLAWLKAYPILIAQRLTGHEISSFIRIYDLRQVDCQILSTKSDNLVWSVTQQEI